MNFKIFNFEEAFVEKNVSENKDFEQYHNFLFVRYDVEINQKYGFKRSYRLKLIFCECYLFYF